MKKILLILFLFVGFSSYSQTSNDPDAVAFIAALNADPSGVDLTVNEMNYITQMVEGMKSIGVWTKIVAAYPVVGGTAFKHKFNLKNPLDTDGAYRSTFPNGMNHNSSGITASSASSQFMKTFLNNNVVSINSNHLSVYAKNITGVTLGGYICTDNTRVSLNTPSFSSNSQTSTSLSKSLLGNSGYSIINRNSITTSYVLNQGLNIGTQNISALTNPSVQEYRFFNRNVGNPIDADVFGNGATLYVSGTISFASIGSGLTDSEAERLSHLIYYCQGILSRQ